MIIKVAKKTQTIFVDEISGFMTKKNMNEIFAWNLDFQGAEMDVIARKKCIFNAVKLNQVNKIDPKSQPKNNCMY